MTAAHERAKRLATIMPDELRRALWYLEALLDDPDTINRVEWNMAVAAIEARPDREAQKLINTGSPAYRAVAQAALDAVKEMAGIYLDEGENVPTQNPGVD